MSEGRSIRTPPPLPWRFPGTNWNLGAFPKIMGIVNVDVGERPLFTILDDPFVLDVVLETKLVERVGHEGETIAEDVEIDIRTLANVPGANTADQARAETWQ